MGNILGYVEGIDLGQTTKLSMEEKDVFKINDNDDLFDKVNFKTKQNQRTSDDRLHQCDRLHEVTGCRDSVCIHIHIHGSCEFVAKIMSNVFIKTKFASDFRYDLEVHECVSRKNIIKRENRTVEVS